MVLKTSNNGRKFIRGHEGVVYKVYLDPVGIKTGGAGHIGPDVDALDVGTKLSKAQVEKWFSEDVEEAEDIVNRHVKVDLPQEAYDALVSFVLNVGPGKKGVKDGFVTLKSGRPSTMLTLLNQNKLEAAAAEFPKWASAKGKPLPGLKRRRLEEQAMFLRGIRLEDDELETNVEADCEKVTPSALRDPKVQSLGAVSTAAALNEVASKTEALAPYSDYALYLFIALTVLALLYTLRGRKESD